MIFSLEVLQAKHGDCLLLHFGDSNDPKIIVIDGGPSGVYNNFLKPRLIAIKDSRTPNEALRLSMVMVSHMDDDHANGICMLTDDIIGEGNDSPFTIDHLWINTFDDIVGNIQLPKISSINASSSAASIASLGIPGLEEKDHSISAVIASTGQGRQLRDNATALTITVNHPFTKLAGSTAVLVRGDTDQSVVDWDELKITVVSPGDEQLQKLQKQWDKDLKKAAADGDSSIIFASLTSNDTSPFNQSSIACLVELEGKKILLTGDARSDHILAGLESNNLLENGKLHVDILKMPHHGSIRNMKEEFLQAVTADHYVISADGSYDNPEKPLLSMLVDHVSKGTVHFTNHTGKKNIETDIDTFLQNLEDANSDLKVVFPKAGADSMVIDLLDEIDF